MIPLLINLSLKNASHYNKSTKTMLPLKILECMIQL